MDKPLAYSYIRMSTDAQLKGDSLRRQITLSAEYAKKNGLKLVEDFNLHDIGVSAYQGDNVEKGSLGKFLQAVHAGEIPKNSYLLVESLDRLTRQKINRSLHLFFEITESGINIVTLADCQLYKAGETEMLPLIYSILVMSRAYEESEIKSKRLSAAWKNKRTNIKKRVLTSICPAWLRVTDDRSGFKSLPDRVKTVRRIFDAAADGQGSGVITRILNSENVPHFGKSNGWVESYITKILKNRAVLGEFQPHEKIDGQRVAVGAVVNDYFPKIINEDKFLEVQIGRRSRAVHGAGRRGPRQKNLFTGIAKCDYCGSPMRFLDKGSGPKGGSYLRCSANVRGMGCVSSSWKYEDFETSVFNFVREFDLRAVIQRSNCKAEKSKIREQLAIEKERLEQLNIRRARTFNLISSATVSTEYISGQLEEQSSDIVAVEKKISELNQELITTTSNAVSSSVDIAAQIEIIRKFDEQSNLENRILVASKLKALIRQIRVASDGSRPKISKAIEFVELQEPNKTDRKKIIDSLQETQFPVARSNPYFIIDFHDAESRLVIPSPSDPTKYFVKSEVIDNVGYIIDRHGNVIYPFEAPNFGSKLRTKSRPEKDQKTR